MVHQGMRCVTSEISPIEAVQVLQAIESYGGVPTRVAGFPGMCCGTHL